MTKTPIEDPKLLTEYIIRCMSIACKKDAGGDGSGFANPFKILDQIYREVLPPDPPGYVAPPKPDTEGLSEEEIVQMGRAWVSYGKHGKVCLTDLQMRDLRMRMPDPFVYIYRLDEALYSKKFKLDITKHYNAIRDRYEKEAAAGSKGAE